MWKKNKQINVEAIQTDTELEFGKYFEQYIISNNMIHYFNYPKNPKNNAYMERFNRTIQEWFFEMSIYIGIISKKFIKV